MTDKLLDHLKRALGETYTIERELSGAGMSRVFVAQEHSLGREVVIKVLPRELAAGVNRERFQQEVQLAARLSHPYIVPLLHAGEHEDLLWFTMPFITGESLKYRLEKEGPLPVRDVIQLSRDVLEALAYAHSKGVMHRDIKPANILVDGGHAVVTDFGVAKALSAAMPTMGSGHTTTGMAIGTPAYMAPEQLAADPAADQRVDIYAMGLLMYELLAGASPFSNSSPTMTMTAQLTRMPDPINQVRKDVPAGLSALIMRCLAKSPDERPATADDVLKALDQISGELAAAEHTGATQSFVVRRLVPITATLALITVAAAATIWVNRSSNLNNTPTIPLPPTLTGDSSHGTALAGGPDSVERPKTRSDSLEIYNRIAAQKGAAKGAAAKTGSKDTVFVIPNIDSMLKVSLDDRFKTLGINMPRPGGFDQGRGGPPGQGNPNQGNGNANRPMKAVVILLGRGGAADTVAHNMEEHLVASLTEAGARRNWTLIPRDTSKSRGFNDSTLSASNAMITVWVSRQRAVRDTVDLIVTVSNVGGAMRNYLTRAIPVNGKPAPDFNELAGQVSLWLRQIRTNPDGTSENGNRGGPPDGFRGGPGQGGGQRGQGGGGGGGGQRPRFQGDSGRGGGGHFTPDSLND